MTIYEETIYKVQRLPESLAKEVRDFIDFLLMKHNRSLKELEIFSSENGDVVEADFSEYLHNLEDYEERLAKGEIHW